MLRFSRLLITEGSKRLVPRYATSYKSKNSVETYYSDYNPDIFVKQSEFEKDNLDIVKKGDFQGYIPIGQLAISYHEGSGSYRSNTDCLKKVESKVEIKFKVKNAEWIPEWLRDKLLQKDKRYINKNGDIIVESDVTKKQMLNQADCVQQIRSIIFNRYNKSLAENNISRDDELLEPQSYKGIQFSKRVPVNLEQKKKTRQNRYSTRDKYILEKSLLEEQRLAISGRRKPKD